MRTFIPHYVMSRRGEKVLVTLLNRMEYADSIKFITLQEEVSKKDLISAEKAAKAAEKNPPLSGINKRQARLKNSLRPPADDKDNPLTTAGTADYIPEGETAAADLADKIDEAVLADVVAKPVVTKEMQAAARKEAREKKAAARKASKAAAAAAEKAAAVTDAE
jgi:hypothetical protein